MKLHESAFYFIFFFLFGVLLASLKLKFLTIIYITALMAFLFLILNQAVKKQIVVNFKWLAALSLLTMCGSLYYFWDDFRLHKNFAAVFNKKINFTGVISDYPQRGASQKIIVDLQNPYNGKILIILNPYPQFNFGDKINFNGVIKKPTGPYANFLAKEQVLGVSIFPKARLIAPQQGLKIKSVLFSIKEKFIQALQKNLPQEEAALASGITIGERSEFSKELKDLMNKSGTTHIVALSGYNITIIAWALTLAMSLYFSRKTTFFATLIFITGFVLMTGAEASIVRAAIMGSIIILAKYVGRLYSIRNAISIAAFLMILKNPKILTFDIGFQLSFLALLGIVFISPAIMSVLKINPDNLEFLNWKEMAISTISAQLAVFPLLIYSLSGFSLLSMPANLLIVPLLPLTMGLGFLVGFLGIISFNFSFFFGWFLHLFLCLELFVIRFFGSLSPMIKPAIGIYWLLFSYIVLVLAVFVIKRKTQTKINVYSGAGVNSSARI